MLNLNTFSMIMRLGRKPTMKRSGRGFSIKKFIENHTILVMYFVVAVFIGIAFAADIDVDSDNNSKVDGASEVYAVGWNGDVDAPQKNDIYDYLIQIDTDADGDLTDESYLTKGIADDNVVEMDDADAADNDYAKFTANGLEGRSYAEVKSDLDLEIGTDVLAQQTIGIADNNLVEIDDADAADNDYAKLTANGIEGREYSEVRTDLGWEQLSDCSGITSGCCQDTDDGIVYCWDGDSVETQKTILSLAPLASPTFTGTVTLPSNQTLLGSPTAAASIDPDTSDGATIGSATKEWSDLYLATGGVIYGENDQSNTITSSAAGWTFNLPINPSDSPGIKLKHKTNNDDVFYLYSDNEVDDTEADILVQFYTSGSLATRITYDGSADEIIVAAPIDSSKGAEFTYMDAGTKYLNDSDGEDYSDSTICEMYFYQSGTSIVEYILPDEPECESGAGKKYCFQSRNASGSIEIIAQDDIVHGSLVVDGAPADGGNELTNVTAAAQGDFICLYGKEVSGTDYWNAWEYSGTWTEDETPE